MVVKTELCSFSETRIYPGHGLRFITKTGVTVVLANSKVCSLYHQRKKPAKLMWTQAWRRMHKKINTEATIKRKARKVVKTTRGYTGLSVEQLKERRVTKPATGAAKKPEGPLKQAAVEDMKKKQKAKQAEKKAARAAAPKAAPAAKSHAGKGR